MGGSRTRWDGPYPPATRCPWITCAATLLVLATLGGQPAHTQPAALPPATPAAPEVQTAPVAVLPVEVVGTAPLPGSGLPRDRIPGNPRGLSDVDLGREGGAARGLPDALERLSGSVTRNEAQSNPFQPDL